MNTQSLDLLGNQEKAISYCELDSISTDQVNEWQEDVRMERQRFWFSRTLHVLAKGAIDISDCQVLVAG